MRFKHTNRKGFWYGFIDFFTAGLFFLIYMPCGLQDELDAVLGYRTQRYYIAYLLGLPTLTVYTIVWMARIAEAGCCLAARRSPPGGFSTRSTRSSGNSTDAIRPSELREERPCNHERNVNKQREG